MTKPLSSDSSDGAGLEQPLSLLRSMLVEGETLQAFTVQRRIFALANRRTFLAATSGRLIAIQRGLIGGFEPVDIRWQDIISINVSAGILGSTLKISALAQPDLVTEGVLRTVEFSGLRKEEAQAVYRICQAQEQAWREKRRLREIEELRAKAGGFQGALADSGGSGSHSATTRLQKARDMLDNGLISDAEFEAVKARIVAQL